MPVLQKIVISDFRNITLAELSFSPEVNCICGENGQGKTNLLDAIFFLSMTKSGIGIPDSFCVKHGAGSFSLSGKYLMQDGSTSTVVVSTGSPSEQSRKTVKRDGKAYRRVSEHIGVFPVVMVSPADVALVADGGEERRRFVNSVLSQMNPAYLAALQRYNRILDQRNRMLKESDPDESLLEVLDTQMSEPAELISECRRSFASDMEKAVSSHYSMLSGGSETVGITYRSDCTGEQSLEELLKSCRNRDLCLKYTGAGIQRDDFVFSMNGTPIRRCGSQGQQKSFLVALKLAQYDIMRERYGFPPTLLLDDLFDKLDRKRISNLLRIVSSRDYGQIFITDTSRERMEEIMREIAPEAFYFTAENGEF